MHRAAGSLYDPSQSQAEWVECLSLACSVVGFTVDWKPILTYAMVYMLNKAVDNISLGMISDCFSTSDKNRSGRAVHSFPQFARLPVWQRLQIRLLWMQALWN